MQRSLPALVIGLKRKPQRLQNFISQFRSRDPQGQIELYHMSALDAQQTAKNQIDHIDDDCRDMLDKNTRHCQADLPSRGAVGCYMSHLMALRWLETCQQDILVVFEDDVVFKHSANIDDMITRSIQHLGTADVLLLGYRRCGLRACIYSLKNMLATTSDMKSFFGMYGYVVTKQGASRILNSSCYPIRGQIDTYIASLALKDRLSVKALTHPIVHDSSDHGDTDIQKYGLHHLKDQFLPYMDDKLKHKPAEANNDVRAVLDGLLQETEIVKMSQPWTSSIQ